MENVVKFFSFLLILLILFVPIALFAITEEDNGIMAVYIKKQGYGSADLERDLNGFDIKGYVDSNSDGGKTLVSSTYGDFGYHVFLNVNGTNGEMNGESQGLTKENLLAMNYTAYDSEDGWQNINGISMKVSTQFINNGEQLQIVYELKNTTAAQATYSLATAADIQIDGDDSATLERLANGSGIRLWTQTGNTYKPVQFVFYGKDVAGTTSIDNLYIGKWEHSGYLSHMFDDNASVPIVQDNDSAFSYSWVNRTLNAGETQKHTVLMEVGKTNTPQLSMLLDNNNNKFYYNDLKINGTVIDRDLMDSITVHYSIDGNEQTPLPAISTTGGAENFTIDLTSLNLQPGTSHTIKIWTTDGTSSSSNVEERTFVVTYLKDPEVSLSTTELAKNVTFKIIDTQNEAQWVDKYQYRFDDGEWIDCEKNTDIPIEKNGNIKIDVRIKGKQQDDYSNIVTVNAKVDNQYSTAIVPAIIDNTSITTNPEQVNNGSGDGTNATITNIDTPTEQENQKVVYTGDESNIKKFAIIVVLAGMYLIATAIKFIRKKNKNKK